MAPSLDDRGRLGLPALAGLPDGVRAPRAGRVASRTGIVHLGIGAFHRAHQAVYTEDAALHTGDDRWGILGVTQRSRTVVDQLRPQDGLYGVLTSDRSGESLRIISSVLDVAFPAEETARVLGVIAAPSTSIVSLTITEKGYCRRPDGALDLASERVLSDVTALGHELAQGAASGGTSAGDAPAVTGIGMLTRALAARFRAGGEPITVLSCDNLVDNGATTGRLVRELAGAAPGSQEFLAWLGSAVRFPGTMVDRIVPATTAAHHEQAERISGLRDEGLVIAEPFGQWVIEDDFAADRPAWEHVGATLAHDVAPFERAKLRMLNGAHSMLAYRGALAGHRTIAEAAQALAPAVEALWQDDVIPTVPAPEGMDLGTYSEDLLERFLNPATGHLTQQVAMDGSQKLPIRLLATAQDRLESGAVPEQIAAAVAAWAAYVTIRHDAAGQAVEVSDPAMGVLDAAAQLSPRAGLDALLAERSIVPAAVAEHEGFVSAVREHHAEIVASLPG